MKKMSSIVFNLSDYPLTSSMESLLSHGLTFVPTPGKLNISQLKSDIDKYTRKCLWKHYWFENDLNRGENISDDIVQHISDDHNEKVESVLKSSKSNFPRTSAPAPLKMYLNSIHSDIIGSCLKKHEEKKHCNISPTEKQAIKTLQNIQSQRLITIKEVDKGGGICIMNTDDYIIEMETQLRATFKNEDGTESKFYIPVKENVLNKKKKEISNLIKYGLEQNIISQSDSKIMEPNGIPGRLYGIPKLHKGIKEGKRIPPCRPIISNSGSNTEFSSAFVDIHSRNLVKKLDSFVEDTPDLLRILQDENTRGCQPSNSFPVTVDVTALYTNIPTHGPMGGLQAFEKALNRRTLKEKSETPTIFLCDLLEAVLDGNIFEFDGNLFQQKIGTAMGTSVAPTYACLFMGWLEEFILSAWSNHKKHGSKPYLWRRYIDDIFFIWNGDVQELNEFIDFINQQHPNIKFEATFDFEKRSIPFLDMSISINENGFLETDLYKKKTAKIQYLLPSSCHPGHITKNIPYSLAYRLLRICSNRDTFKLRLEELRQNLLLRSYHPRVIQNAFDKITCIDREEALKKVTKTNKESNVAIVTNFHPSIPSISKIMKKHWSVMIDDSPEMKNCFSKSSIVSYKRHKNLRDMLIRAKLPPIRGPQRKSNGFKNCGELCKMCAYSPRNITTIHRSAYTKQTYEINSQINCKSHGVIYKISCKKCTKGLKRKSYRRIFRICRVRS